MGAASIIVVDDDDDDDGGCGGCGSGGGGGSGGWCADGPPGDCCGIVGGWCKPSLDGMLRASGSADMPGNDALLEQPDVPSDEHDVLLLLLLLLWLLWLLFLDCDTGDGVPSA